MERWCQVLDASLTQAKASTSSLVIPESQRQAHQRFLRNEHMNHDDLLESHFFATAQRAKEVGSVLVVHDTTDFAFTLEQGYATRKHMPIVSKLIQGFYWHPSLVFAADGSRAPLGLVASRPYAHLKGLAHDEKSMAYWKSIQGVFENESARWPACAAESQAMLSGVKDVIHVMDREGDDYKGFATMLAQKMRFIIRLAYDRILVKEDGRLSSEKIRDALAKQDWHPLTREVFLNARQPTTAGKKAKEAALPRKARKATLSVRGTQITIARPVGAPSSLAETLSINVVEVLERNPPAGEHAVRWVLMTTEPVDTQEACWQVTDGYRARWSIEEFFKALKTGTDYLESQQGSAHALLSQLALKAIVAWQLLALRHLAQEKPTEPAELFFSASQLRVLHLRFPETVPVHATLEEAMAGVIRFGGYVKKGRAVGWLILGRGWDRLLKLVEGYELAQKELQRKLEGA